MLFQFCMTLIPLQNTKEDILTSQLFLSRHDSENCGLENVQAHKRITVIVINGLILYSLSNKIKTLVNVQYIYTDYTKYGNTNLKYHGHI